MIQRLFSYLLLTGMLACIFCGYVQAKSDVLKIGISNGYPPYYYYTDRGLEGVCVEIVENISEAMGLRLEYVEFPWKRLLLSAQKGEVDAIMPLFKTAERQKYLKFENLILAYEEVNFFVNKNSPLIEVNSHEALFQHLIGVVSGYSYGKLFDSRHDLKTVVTQNDNHLLKMFANNRFPVGIGNRFVIAHNATLLGVMDNVVFLNPPLSKEPLYMGFTRNGEKAHLTGRFSRNLEQFKKSERYQKIVVKYGLE
ncbi:MAG: transporter substrate-binding domain-containing protein [Desulfocapsaceae bacterium]|nr:transporter substrate-binding domain-containing protein [Desulfocapsaceae bacterium]